MPGTARMKEDVFHTSVMFTRITQGIHDTNKNEWQDKYRLYMRGGVLLKMFYCLLMFVVPPA